MTKSIAEIVGTLVAELTPLASEERMRAVQASLMLLGEAVIKAPQAEKAALDGAEGDSGHLPERARSWMRQNGVTLENLQLAFLFASDGIEVIASEIPGRNGSERTLNAYVLAGISQLLTDGNPTFGDRAARALCESSGCYDNTNHSKYLKNKGNLFSGSKEKGWTLTAPGLKKGAALIKQLAEGKEA